jgi:hypothetical protein
MKQENIEKIILKQRNVVLCKKFDGSLVYLDSEPADSNQIPSNLRTKISGVDMGLFFEAIGKNSISHQELGVSKPKKEERVENNFA